MIRIKVMAGYEDTPMQTHPALHRAQRIERALNHVARAVELELADIALQSDILDEATRENLRGIGAALLRVSQVGVNTANSLARTIGEELTELPVAEVQTLIPETSTQHVDLKVSEDKARDTTPIASHQEHQPVATPDVTGELEPPATTEQLSPAARTPDKKRPQYEGEMYAHIVSDKQTPVMELREGMEAIPIRIISDDTIVLNGEKVVLDGDRLFAFNALMRLRDEITTAKDMRALGFRLEGASASVAFSKAIGELTSELQSAAGTLNVGIIKKIGKAAGTKYAVNPAVVLVDERVELDDLSSDDTPETVKKKQ